MIIQRLCLCVNCTISEGAKSTSILITWMYSNGIHLCKASKKFLHSKELLTYLQCNRCSRFTHIKCKLLLLWGNWNPFLQNITPSKNNPYLLFQQNSLKNQIKFEGLKCTMATEVIQRSPQLSHSTSLDHFFKTTPVMQGYFQLFQLCS